ncbi:hypothetical protein [Flavobacterium sp.]|uniref:hypothetical protein n=1 Tax=Flavobacterium sp. TaxID=239 RepID=UPI0008B2316C|nr:hypothetical protein [Flavobacterium sp.]OGS65801.1 MAG: hypothetical protein A2X21_02390 [Flavobacteria bacterium GWA2_35_26]HCF03052.1 hypothetical protein [Flavobacterium sp.]
MSNKLVFLCGARDFHAMDWYKSSKELMLDKECCVLTDLIAGEGFKKIINDKDKVYKLLILDRFLFQNQSSLGDKWRNLLKLLVLPLQVILLKRFAKKHPNAIYHAHSMYYLVLARAAKVSYIGTPQGSDILVKPYRSKFYKHFTVYGLKMAKHITVDSKKMQEGVFNLSKKNAYIIQNGIDVSSIKKFQKSLNILNQKISHRSGILSIRGFTELYRIKEVLQVRNQTESNYCITFIYPFYESLYKTECNSLIQANDLDLGRVDRIKMYELLSECELVMSIPSSDSSPRSVYEAIFCGSPVAISYNSYYDSLPECMKSRIIIVNLSDNNWLIDAINKAKEINKTPFIPSRTALELFDQKESFKKLQKLLFQ